MEKEQEATGPAGQKQHLFIVRIWSETPSLTPGRWRGSVEHVPTHRQFYFASLSDLNDFITLLLNNKQPQAQGPQGQSQHDEKNL